MADDGYIKFGDFFTEIKRICNSFIGKEIIDTSFILPRFQFSMIVWIGAIICHVSI